jgi:hypothetical protein
MSRAVDAERYHDELAVRTVGRMMLGVDAGDVCRGGEWMVCAAAVGPWTWVGSGLQMAT